MRNRRRYVALAFTTVALSLLVAPVAGAAVNADRTATSVAGALAGGGGLTVTGASFATIPATGNPAGIGDSSLAGMPTAGGTFAVLSSGNVALAPSATQVGNQSANNGGPARGAGGSDRDAVVLKVDFTVPSNANCVSFDFRFFSEEFPEYVGRSFNDAFIAEVDGTSWTTTASNITAPGNIAFDPAGRVISINSTGPTSVTPENAAGTTYDAGTQLLRASKSVSPGSHSIYFSVFDQGDSALDSTVFIDNLAARNASAGTCVSGATPASGGGTPPAFGPGGVVTFPPTKKCTSRRLFKITLRERAGITYDFATIFVNGKKVNVFVRYQKKWVLTGRPSGAMIRVKRFVAYVDLRGLAKGRYKVKIVVLTTSGGIIQGTRKYRTCTKRLKGGVPKL